MAIKFDLPDSMVEEYKKYNELYLLGSSRTSIGNISFTSSSSGLVYNVTNNTGQNGLMILLKTALADYIISAIDINAKGDKAIQDDVLNKKYEFGFQNGALYYREVTS